MTSDPVHQNGALLEKRTTEFANDNVTYEEIKKTTKKKNRDYRIMHAPAVQWLVNRMRYDNFCKCKRIMTAVSFV